MATPPPPSTPTESFELVPPPSHRPLLGHSCLLFPLLVAGWWYWTKRKARRVVALIRNRGDAPSYDYDDVRDGHYEINADGFRDHPLGRSSGSHRSGTSSGRWVRGLGHAGHRHKWHRGECEDAFRSWYEVARCDSAAAAEEEMVDSSTSRSSRKFVLWFKGSGTGSSGDRNHSVVHQSRRDFVSERGSWSGCGGWGGRGRVARTTAVAGDLQSPQWLPVEDPAGDEVDPCGVELTDSTVTPWGCPPGSSAETKSAVEEVADAPGMDLYDVSGYEDDLEEEEQKGGYSNSSGRVLSGAASRGKGEGEGHRYAADVDAIEAATETILIV